MSGEVAKPAVTWVTGAGGLIGSYLAQPGMAPPARWRVRGLTRADLELTDVVAVQAAFQHDDPQLVIHCAALSQSVACQANPVLARQANVEATALLAELAAGIPLIFFSTDLVFDGTKGAYRESDPINPLTVYAQTKAQAEQIVLANPRHTVIRTSLNGGISPAGNRGFNEELRRAWTAGKRVRLFIDEFRSPLPAAVTAAAVWELAALNRPGLYHLAGSQRLSRWQIGRLLATRWPGLNPQMEAGNLADFTGAPRSPDTSLDSSKIQGLLSFPLPGLAEWLAANPEAPF